MTEHLQKLINFISELEKLKKVYRQNRTLDSSRFENSAEHSWHVTLMAVLMKEYFPDDIDFIKVVKMLLIHDVVEIDTGDTMLYDDEQKKLAVSSENIAAKRIFGLLPVPQKDEFINLWYEFDDQLTLEARCAAVMDGLQPLLNHAITGNDNENPYGITKSQVIKKKKFIKSISPELWQIAKDFINKGVATGLYKNE